MLHPIGMKLMNPRTCVLLIHKYQYPININTLITNLPKCFSTSKDLSESGNSFIRKGENSIDINANVNGDKIETAGDAINNIAGLGLHFQKVTRTTGRYLGITAVSSACTFGLAIGVNYAGLFSSVNEVLYGAGGTMFVAFCTSMYAALKIGAPEYIGNKMVNEAKRDYYAKLMHVCMGVTLTPSLILYNEFIPAALVTTLALVAGPITASFTLPKGKLLRLGSFLNVGLWGLLGVGVGGIFIPALHDINMYGGIMLFSVYSAYDTHNMIKEYEEGNSDYIKHAANYSLNAINLFVRLLELMGRSESSRND